MHCNVKTRCEALKALAKEKDISEELLFNAIEEALKLVLENAK